MNEKEREKIEFRVYSQAMLRVKLEDIENARENEKLEYEVINIQRYIRNFIENYEVDGNFVYSVSNGNYIGNDGTLNKGYSYVANNYPWESAGRYWSKLTKQIIR